MLRLLGVGLLVLVACGKVDSELATDAGGSSSSGSSSSGGSSSGGSSSGASSSGEAVAPECPRGVESLVVEGAGIRGLAVDADAVYWVNSETGVLAKVPRCGGTPITLVTEPRGSSRVALDDTTVYWTNEITGTVRSIPKTGGAPTTLASNQLRPGSIVAGTDAVYWLGGRGRENESVFKVPKSGGKREALAQNTRSATAWYELAIDSTMLYYTDRGESADDGGVFGIPLAGGNPNRLTGKVGSARAIALDDESYYVAAQSGTVTRVPFATNMPLPLATNIDNAGFIAVDASRVYWTNDHLGTGSLWSTEKTDGSAVPTRIDEGPGQIRGLAVFGTSLYWTFDAGSGARVMRRTL